MNVFSVFAYRLSYFFGGQSIPSVSLHATSLMAPLIPLPPSHRCPAKLSEPSSPDTLSLGVHLSH